MVKLNKFSDAINFDAEAHEYTVKRGKGVTKLRGVTRWIDTFFSSFNADFMSKLVVQKEGGKYFGRDPAEVALEWEKNGSDAAEDGSLIHREVQQYVSKERDLLDDSEMKSYGAFTFYNAIMAQYPGCRVHPEQVVFSKKLKLAGTVDLIVEIGNGRLLIVDWKTNKEIKFEGYINSKGKMKMGTGVCKDLPDCNHAKYTLQLSAYAYILEKDYGYSPERLVLVHLTDENHYVHKIDYRKDKIEVMLNENK